MSKLSPMQNSVLIKKSNRRSTGGQATSGTRVKLRSLPRWSVYLLRCADQTLYCGTTNDLS
jgi:hypothetical protein